MTLNSLVNPAHANMDTMPNKNKRITRNKTDFQYHGVNAINLYIAFGVTEHNVRKDGLSLLLRLEPSKALYKTPSTSLSPNLKHGNYTSLISTARVNMMPLASNTPP